MGPIVIFAIAFGISSILSSYQNALTGKGLGCVGIGGYAIGIVALSSIPFLPLLILIKPKWILPKVQKGQLTVDLEAAEKIRAKYTLYIQFILGFMMIAQIVIFWLASNRF